MSRCRFRSRTIGRRRFFRWPPGRPWLRIVRVLLDAVAEPARVVVAAAEPLVDDVRAALASEDLASVNVVAVSGPAGQSDCLRAAMEYLRRASFSTSHVLVHDISRPLASADLAQRVVAGMRQRRHRRDAGTRGDRQRQGRRCERVGHRHGRSGSLAYDSISSRLRRRSACRTCSHRTRPTTSTRSRWPSVPLRPSPTSTVTPTHFAQNCPETPSSSRRSLRAGGRTLTTS